MRRVDAGVIGKTRSSPTEQRRGRIDRTPGDILD
jgi:hypothetical protein